MNYVWGFIIIVSCVIAFLCGRTNELANGIFSSGKTTVNLFLTLLGMMMLWSGLMRIAEKSGITSALSKLLSPLLKLLFPDLKKDSPAAKAISLNMVANLLGLGNAATPLGLIAMKELLKLSPKKDAASDNMITFVVMNTASIQLIPTTVGILRASFGAANPLDIMPAVWLSSIIALVSGITTAKILSKRRRLGERYL